MLIHGPIYYFHFQDATVEVTRIDESSEKSELIQWIFSMSRLFSRFEETSADIIEGVMSQTCLPRSLAELSADC